MKLIVRLAVSLILVCCVLSLLLTISIYNTNSASVFLKSLRLNHVRYVLNVKHSDPHNITATTTTVAKPGNLLSEIEKPKVGDNGARQRIWTYTTAASTVLNVDILNITDKRFGVKAAIPLLVNDGPGANGEPVNVTKSSLGVEDQAKFDVMYKKLGYNAFASDLAQINRKVKDPRPQSCKDLRYPTNLPEISVVIPFRDEHLSVLLRTVYSIVGNTPTNLLREVILVDDGSVNDDTRDVQNLLDSEDHFWHKVSVLRLEESVGLMMARQAGVDRSTANYFAILDSHMEVAEGWVEPLLYRLLQKPKALLCPAIGAIHRDTFSVKWGGYDGRPNMFPFFDWNLNQILTYYSSDFKTSIQNFTEPFPLPTVQGMMIVMKKSWFYDLGGFDPGMKVWGSEQFEMSIKHMCEESDEAIVRPVKRDWAVLRKDTPVDISISKSVWMCGGVVESVRCSYVAHLYRSKVVWTFHGEAEINKIRFAEVWLDDYKKYAYTLLSSYLQKEINRVDYGNIEERMKIRHQNNCSSFENFMQNMKKIGHVYDPCNAFYRGKLCNKQHNTCLHYNESDQLVTVKHRQASQRFELSQEHRVHTSSGYSFLIYNNKGQLMFQKFGSNEGDLSSKWTYVQNGTMVHCPTGKCLAVVRDVEVILDDCKHEPAQFWYWVPYEH